VRRALVELLLAAVVAACGSRPTRTETERMPTRSIEEVLAAHNDSLMATPGVVGTAIGLCDGEPCIRVFVVDSAAAARVRLEPRLDGHPLRVEVSGSFLARGAPAVRQLVRERLQPNARTAFAQIEEEIARVCVELRCPHPYLGAESVDEPREVWWLNTYQSDEERRGVAAAYAANARLMAALASPHQRKRALVAETTERITHFRADRSRATVWRLAGARFLVIGVATGGATVDAAFEAEDGTLLVVRPVATEAEARRIAESPGGVARVFAIRPAWSVPSDDVIAAEPTFWSASPAATPHRQR
jgi:hypothetical protein